MGRNPRFDAPGRWHHVMNRGIARRTLFETEDDIRFFLSRLAWAVHRGWLEVHAYCVMTTHFHLLVRSPLGELSRALQAIQNEYVRRFNRKRRRDGSLVRGRFRSRPVDSLRYRETLLRYIDDNPVAARVVPSTYLYPHGSARHYVAPQGPPWLSRTWVERCLRDTFGPTEVRRSYPEVFGAPLSPALRRLIERRMVAPPHRDDPLDELFEAAAPAVRAWMRRKAELADGTRPGLPLADPESVEEVFAGARSKNGEWSVTLARNTVDGWALAKIVLLRELCGATLDETASRTGRSLQNAWRLCRQHKRLVVVDEDYAARMAALTKSVLLACHGASSGTSR
jgi:REP element-mobilizing transposase RayT